MTVPRQPKPPRNLDEALGEIVAQRCAECGGPVWDSALRRGCDRCGSTAKIVAVTYIPKAQADATLQAEQEKRRQADRDYEKMVDAFLGEQERVRTEREKRERAEAERDDWHSLATRLRTTLEQSNADALTAERRLDEAVKALRDAWPEIDALARTGRASQSRRRHELVGCIRQFLEASQSERGAEGEAPSTERTARAALNPDPPNPDQQLTES